MNYFEHAKVLTQALPYIQSLSGKIVLIKYGGNAMTSDELRKSVATDIVLLQCVGIKPVIVHGGGPHISEFINKIGEESRFIDGLRYTDEKTIEIVQMVLGGKVNKDIVSLIESAGGKALGLCGIDASFIKAKKLESSIDLGFVGEITSIDTTLLTTLLSSGYIPVIGSVATNEDCTQTYNINADICASKLASALKAEKLILLTNVPGLMINPNDEATLISSLRLHEIKKIQMDGIIKSGMIPKIDCCVEAIRMGVKEAHIIDGTLPHSILLELLSQEGIGTMIC
ncbi:MULTISPECIES: acetylglutamate kinase [Clostridium]|uniref:acetylglutamate kinase n=1 Tax=Clostridium TaxID=1485 RepID=UPI00115ACD3B|nr:MULTISPECIES: acetylglutamate kinase [Clostridium]MDB1945464.1 acetylglutamate kinase [Clostridium tertium]MDB1951949.1 acetylglutamate kinase [Clostridium tertium]MDB1971124.1 acetylglutamate kinase [Clostridium tertium]MDU1277296.1 acetylglutamate kinase [Clostridium sp.]MDU3526937.1 acetylglutamate kinase [Clostridium sp.]